MKGGFNRKHTLEKIEQHDWGDPTVDTYLVTTCHRLRRKPLDQFTVEDLRIMIGQKISLPILIPIAVEVLEADPLAEGDYFPGDLLAMVLSVDDSFWASHVDYSKRMTGVLERLRGMLPSLEEEDLPIVLRLLENVPQARFNE